MKQLLKVLHRLSYLFVIPIFIILTMLYAAGRFILNIPCWILTGKSFLETEDIVMNIITEWMDTYYPIFTKTENENTI